MEGAQLLRALRAQLSSATERQERLLRVLGAGSGACGGDLSVPQLEMLAALRHAAALGGSATEGMVLAEDAAAEREAAVEQVKAKAKAAFLKLRAEAQQSRQDLQAAQVELRSMHTEQAESREVLAQQARAHAESNNCAATELAAAQGRCEEQLAQFGEQLAQQRAETQRMAAQLASEEGAKQALCIARDQLEAELSAAAAANESSAAGSCAQAAQVEALQRAEAALKQELSGKVAQLASQSERDADRVQRLEQERRQLQAERDAGAQASKELAMATARNEALKSELDDAAAARELAERRCAEIELRDQERLGAEIQRQADAAAGQKKVKVLQREVRRLEVELHRAATSGGPTAAAAPPAVAVSLPPPEPAFVAVEQITPPQSPQRPLACTPAPLSSSSTQPSSGGHEVETASAVVEVRVTLIRFHRQPCANTVLNFCRPGAGAAAVASAIPAHAARTGLAICLLPVLLASRKLLPCFDLLPRTPG